MLLEHIELRILPQIIHALGTAVNGAAAPGAYFRAKISQKLGVLAVYVVFILIDIVLFE